MDRTESAIEAYLKHYGRIDFYDMCQFFGIKPEMKRSNNFIYVIFRDFWEKNGWWIPHLPNQYRITCKNIIKICRVIWNIINEKVKTERDN